MIKNYIKYFLPLSIILFSTLTSCKKVFEEDNYIAYFGGEILNPQDKFILFMKDNEVIDTIFLDKNNRNSVIGCVFELDTSKEANNILYPEDCRIFNEYYILIDFKITFPNKTEKIIPFKAKLKPIQRFKS